MRIGWVAALVLLFPAWPTNSAAAGAAPPAAQAAFWSDDKGSESARFIIERCLAKAGPPGGCKRSAYNECELSHGTMSQHDLNDCAAFSAKAWEALLQAREDRVKAVVRKVMLDKRAQPSLEGERLQASNQWHRWISDDCAFQSALSKGGTLHPLEDLLCRSDHAADRAVELERLASWWDR